MPPLGIPLANSKFTLNTAGIAGFFGGEEVLSAIGTAHLYEGGRWLGWYNSPGSYVIAKHFGRLTTSPFWGGLFSGPHESPAVVFGLDIKRGPSYIGALSGTMIPTTGHLGHLTMERIKEVEAEHIDGRETRPVSVGYLAMKRVDSAGPIRRLPLKGTLLSLVPTTVSMVACIMCALVCDWFSFSMILLGIISTGFASLVIGKGRPIIRSRVPAPGAPLGHGILVGVDEVTVIKGKERDVNVVTQGRFDLVEVTHHLDDMDITAPKYQAIGTSSLLLLVQFFLQLLLVPQGTLFGQTMFLASLCVSWWYNIYVSSLVKEKLQTEILLQAIGNPEMVRFRIGTRTTMAVFVCLLLFHRVERLSSERDLELRIRILRECIPNDTNVWRRWREKVAQQLLHVDDDPGLLPYLAEDEEDRGFPDLDQRLLRTLLEDAVAAFRGYFHVRHRLPDDSSLKA